MQPGRVARKLVISPQFKVDNNCRRLASKDSTFIHFLTSPKSLKKKDQLLPFKRKLRSILNNLQSLLKCWRNLKAESISFSVSYAFRGDIFSFIFIEFLSLNFLYSLEKPKKFLPIFAAFCLIMKFDHLSCNLAKNTRKTMRV